jgi:hypothetical protein
MLRQAQVSRGIAFRPHPVRIAAWSFVGLLLLAPAIAMRFTHEVQWTASDFIFAAVLLFGIGGAIEWVVRRTPDRAYRFGAGLALLAVLALVWINGAVGLIGSEREPANRMYAVVLAIGVVGAALARLQARGLSRTLVIMAAAQAIIGSVALAMRWGTSGPIWPFDVLGLTVGFSGLFLTAALLFGRSAANAGSIAARD